MSGSTPSHAADGILVVSYNAQSLRGDMKVDPHIGQGKGRKRGKKGKPKVKLQAQMPTINASSKLSMVLHQVATRKAHVTGFQEMRAFDTGISIVDGFVVCRSAADRHAAHGCGLAFNKKIPWLYVGGEKVFVARQEIAIELAEPRCLCVGVSTAACEWLCVSTHGPLPTSTDTTPDTHWTMVT